MSKPAFTPGPWRTFVLPKLLNTPNNIGIATEFKAVISTDCTGAEFEAKYVAVAIGTPTSGDATAANARLIAASPALYDGCAALLGLIQLLSYRNDISDAARQVLTESHRVREAEAAIAKATEPTA